MSGDAPEQAVNGTATYNIEDDTLRWFNEFRLDPNEYAQAKDLGFKLWRGTSAWVATWTPEREDFLLEHVEGIEYEADPDDPQARLDRFASRAAAAERRADQRFKAGMDAVSGIPLGQPILVDHHSAPKHRRALERSERNMRAGLEEQRTAEYWRGRAAGAERRARQKSDPGVIRRRIERLETDFRRLQRSLDGLPASGSAEERPGHRASREHLERWTGHLARRVAFEQARLALLKPAPFAPVTIYRKDDVVRTRRYGKCQVVRIGPKNVRVVQLEGPTKGWTWLVPPHDLEPWTDNPG